MSREAPLLGALAALSKLSVTPCPEDTHVVEACEIVRGALSASDAYVVAGGDPHFRRIGSGEDPETYEIKQKGYWLVWQTAATYPDIPVGMFDVRERQVEGGRALDAGGPGTHIASILPADESNSELFIARGPWPHGLTEEQVRFVASARPMLAYLVCNALDTKRRSRQREQLRSLADVSKAFSEARDMDRVLTSIATAMARASGWDWVMITLYDASLENVVDRALNVARYSNTETAQMARDGRITAQPADPAAIAFRRQLAETGQPMLLPNILESDLTLPQGTHEFLTRAHLVSTAIFPLLFRGEMLGLAFFASTTRREFAPEETELLSALASQAATTVKGLRLYHDLEQSKDALRKYADRLEETNRVEHLLARTDALTGLPNRRYIEEATDAETARSARHGRPLSLVMGDLDHFKDINDSFGHQIGDEALRFVASLARQACRTSDVVGRWGGDEFAFILPETPLEGALEFGERVSQLFSESRFAHPRVPAPQQITISLGIAEAEANGSNAYDILGRADEALYRAKALGRNRIQASVDGRRAA